MNFPNLIASLSTYFAMPFLELPGTEAQFKMAPHLRDEALVEHQNKEYKKSAILILLYPDKDGNACVVFTKRNEYDGPHSGQVSFPGGKFEDTDVNIIQTAIRETAEEIGVTLENKKVLGRLSTLKVPVSGFEIYPIIGYTNETPKFTRDKTEVEKILEISVADLAALEADIDVFPGSSKMKIKAPYYPLRNEKLWGATAMITSEFLEMVSINYRP